MTALHSPTLSVCLTGRNWSADGSSFQRRSWLIRDHLCFMFCLYCPLRVISRQTVDRPKPAFVRFGPKVDKLLRCSECPLCARRWGNRPAILWIAEEFGCC